MATLVEYFNRQSNKANWSYQDQLCGPDGAPLWAEVPNELTVSLVARGRDGAAVALASSADGTDQLLPDEDGIINVNILPNTLGALDEGMYDIWLLVNMDGYQIERVYGRLPLCEGIGSMLGTTVGTPSVSVGRAKVWQLKNGLIDAGVFDVVEAAVGAPTTDNKVNVMWTQGDVSVVNDAFYTLIKTATGWSTSAMSAFYTACAARSY